MRLTAVFGACPTDELIGIYVVYNCCSVMLNRVTFRSRTVRGNCYGLVCKNCSVLEVMLFVFFSFGHKCLCNWEEYRLRRKCNDLLCNWEGWL
jgi:hypothetical protein